jgi:hypothetical protein
LPEEPTAALWFEKPIQQVTITPLGPFSATADGACPVELPGGRRAYAKPRPDVARNLVVAREKIASDLAFLLGFRVAPVLVCTPQPPTWQFHTALSLATLPSARAWGAGGQQHLGTVAEQLEALRVFWTWIGDQDHSNHGANLLFAVGSGGCDILAIDHSWSLCHGNKTDSLAVGVSPGYGTGGLPGAAGWARAAIEKILSLEWGRIEEVVQRLHPILAVSEQETILKILKDRRGNLLTFFGL